MKKILTMALVGAALIMGITSCERTKDEKVEDGVYLVGEASPWSNLAHKAAFWVTRNERVEVEAGELKPLRSTLKEIYAPLQKGKSFQIAVVEGGNAVKYGGTLVMTYQGSGSDDHPVGIKAYYYTPNEGSSFTVEEDGMYHIVYETSLNKIIICKANWGIRGVGPAGWGFNEMEPSNGDKTWTITDIEVPASGGWKFSYDGGWKLGVDDTVWTDCTVSVGTNYGAGSIVFSGDVGKVNIIPCGADFALPEAANKGIYTFVMEWTEDGWNVNMTKTGDIAGIDPATQVLSLIGSAVGGWDVANDVDLVYQSTDAAGFASYQTTNLNLPEGGELKVRKDKDWATSWGYSAANITGDVENFVDNGGNIKVVAGKTYATITFKMNWDTDAWELNFTE
ncbi:MAG: hypothetical protein LBQ31_08310 [Bacteroidales bacterium]|jgi:hypothetical protein|nr:hypothetical protein [Bacteroidales bacterium]